MSLKGVKTMVAVVWALAIIFTALLMSIWYFFQPVFTYVTIQMDNSMKDMGISSTSSDNVVTLLKLGINIAIPIMIIGLWIWAIISSHRKDPRGFYT